MDARINIKNLEKLVNSPAGNLYSFDIEEVYGKMLARQLGDDIKCYCTFSSHNGIQIDAIQKNVPIQMFKEDYSKILSYAKKLFGSKKEVEEAQIKSKWDFLSSYVYMKRNEKGKFLHFKDVSPYFRYSHENIFHLISYAKNGEKSNITFYPKKDSNYHISSGCVWYSIFMDFQKHDIKEYGVTMKFFQNGKILLEGLSNKEWNKIEYLLNLIGSIY